MVSIIVEGCFWRRRSGGVEFFFTPTDSDEQEHLLLTDSQIQAILTCLDMDQQYFEEGQ